MRGRGNFCPSTVLYVAATKKSYIFTPNRILLIQCDTVRCEFNSPSFRLAPASEPFLRTISIASAGVAEQGFALTTNNADK